VYLLPSDGWRPGGNSFLALATGIVDARLTNSGACAWLESPGSNGQSRTSFLWPAGYGVRFNPTELTDGRGHVVARAGKLLSVGGGLAPMPAKNRCTTPGMQTWLVQSGPIKLRHG
jgi:hypothetical protein